MYHEAQTYRVDITETRVSVFKRAAPAFSYCMAGPAWMNRPPDKVWKEIWEVENGKLVRKDDIHGTHAPERQVSEKIDFPDSPQ